MVIIEIFETPVNVKYKTTLISKASLVVLICSLVSTVGPFFLAYKSEGFWLKHGTFYEQPRVKFKGHYLLIATTNNSSKTIICSTFKYYRNFLEGFDDCSIIKAREEDADKDDTFDLIYFNFQLNLGKNVQLSSINLVLPIDYELRSTCLLEMESAIVYQQYIQAPVTSELSILADLHLHQAEAIRCSKFHKNLAYNKSVIEENGKFEEYYLEHILKEYAARSVKTTLSNILTTFQIAKKDTFAISLTVRYPNHAIYFKPNILQIIKMAWVQYFAIYVLVAWMMFKVKEVFFRKKWAVFYCVDPLKSKK